MPRLRGRVPVGRAVRSAHGDDARRAAAAARRACGASRNGSATGRAPAPLAAARVHVGRVARRSACGSCPARLGLPAAVGAVRSRARSTCPSAARPTRGSSPAASWTRGCATRTAPRRGVMRATGARVARPPAAAACCGALHLHAGRAAEARTLARPRHRVDARRRAGRRRQRGLRRGDEGVRRAARHARGARVQRAGARLLRMARAHGRRCALRATGDPRSSCRIRATCATCRRRTARCAPCSRPRTTLVETADEGLCCGAGGAYCAHATRAVAAHPRPQGRRRCAPRPATPHPIVASANPGCMVQLRGAGIDARHPADLIAEALDD